MNYEDFLKTKFVWNFWIIVILYITKKLWRKKNLKADQNQGVKEIN